MLSIPKITENKPHTAPQLGSAALVVILVVQVMLKLMLVILWPWWAVLWPVWIVPAVLVVAVLAGLSVAIVRGIAEEIRDYRNRKQA